MPKTSKVKKKVTKAKNKTAKNVVTFVKKLLDPWLPKTVDDEPLPNAAPASTNLECKGLSLRFRAVQCCLPGKLTA